MSELTMYSGLLCIAGIFSLVFAIRFIINKEFAENYIKNSSKAALWRKMLGVERAYKLTKTVFVPMGIVISIGFIAFGGYNLITEFILK